MVVSTDLGPSSSLRFLAGLLAPRRSGRVVRSWYAGLMVFATLGCSGASDVGRVDFEDPAAEAWLFDLEGRVARVAHLRPYVTTITVRGVVCHPEDLTAQDQRTLRGGSGVFMRHFLNDLALDALAASRGVTPDAQEVAEQVEQDLRTLSQEARTELGIPDEQALHDAVSREFSRALVQAAIEEQVQPDTSEVDAAFAQHFGQRDGGFVHHVLESTSDGTVHELLLPEERLAHGSLAEFRGAEVGERAAASSSEVLPAGEYRLLEREELSADDARAHLAVGLVDQHFAAFMDRTIRSLDLRVNARYVAWAASPHGLEVDATDELLAVLFPAADDPPSNEAPTAHQMACAESYLG